MKRSVVPQLAIVALMLAGCASSEAVPGTGRRAEGGAQDAHARYFEEIRSPAGLGLWPGLECVGR